MSFAVYLCPLCQQHMLGWTSLPNYCDRCNRPFAPGVRPRLLNQPMKAVSVAAPVLMRKQMDPILVTPHQCQVCQGDINEAFNCRETTTYSHQPKGCRTSAYSILFNAQCCGAYLEAPRRLEGRRTTCPECSKQFDIPSDIAFRRSILPDEPHMVFDCPECRRDVTVPQEYNGQPVAGRKAVCPWCVACIDVPPCGKCPG